MQKRSCVLAAGFAHRIVRIMLNKNDGKDLPKADVIGVVLQDGHIVSLLCMGSAKNSGTRNGVQIRTPRKIWGR